MCASAYSNVIITPSCIRLCVHTRAAGIKLYYYYNILQTRPITILHKLIKLCPCVLYIQMYRYIILCEVFFFFF